METSKPSQPTLFDETELLSMSSAAGSRAPTYHSLANALASKVLDLVCGQSSGELLARFDPGSSQLRTSQACLVSGWTPYSATLPRSGMMLSGTVYQLPPSAPLTGVTGSGSWPAPRANDAEKRGNIAIKARNGLPAAVKMWPTPTTRDWKDGSAQSCENVPANGLLGRVVHQFPTPRAQSARGSGPSRIGNKADLQTVVGGSLNPDWVEWLMGLPTGWTEVSGWKSRKAPRASPKASKTEPPG